MPADLPPPHERDPNRERIGIAGDEPVERIAEPLSNLTDQVARIGRTEGRNDEVGTLGDTPNAKRQAEILFVIGKLTPSSGDVDQAAHAEGRVEGKARKRLSGVRVPNYRLHSALFAEMIGSRTELREQKVAQRIAHRVG